MTEKKNIKLVEIFMAKAGRGNNGFDNCFHGTIQRETDEKGNPIVFGKIYVNDKIISAMAENQWKLGEKLDELVLFALNNENQCRNDCVDSSLN